MNVFAFLLAALVCAAPCCASDTTQILMPGKSYFDSSATTGDGFIYASGTLTGSGIGYPNNSTVIACYKDRMECLTYAVEQIGPNQIARLDWPTVHTIQNWGSDEILAWDEPLPSDCVKTTISIRRKSESVLWVQEPINRSSAKCKDADERVYKWTIEDSQGWKELYKDLK